MWANNDDLSEREDDDWVYPLSEDTDEEQQEEEDWKEIEVELFSQLHYNSKQLDGASASVPQENPPNTLDEGDPMRVIRRPLLRNTDVRAPKTYHCDNCHELGHLSRDCNEKSREICILCGEFGHLQQQCPYIFCYNCKLPGHRFAECPSTKNSYVTCYRCQMFGHIQPNCPDLWRRYCYTTTRGPLVTSNCITNTRIYCYNCGEKGHYGFECMKDPMNPFIYSRYPFVVNYDSCWADIENKSKRRKIEPDTSRYTFNIPDAMKNVIDFSKSTRKRKLGSKHAEDSNAYFISLESKRKDKSKRTKMQRFRRAARRRMASGIRKST